MKPLRWGCLSYLVKSWIAAKKVASIHSRGLRIETLHDRLPMAADAFEPLENSDSIEQAIVRLDPSIEIQQDSAESGASSDIPGYSSIDNFAWDFAYTEESVDGNRNPDVAFSPDWNIVWREPFEHATTIPLEVDTSVDVSLSESESLVLLLPSDLVRGKGGQIGSVFIVDTLFEASSFQRVVKDHRNIELTLGDDLQFETLSALTDGKWRIRLVPTPSVANDAVTIETANCISARGVVADYEISIEPLNEDASANGVGLTKVQVVRTSLRFEEDGGIAVETADFPVSPLSPGGAVTPDLDGGTRPDGPGNSGPTSDIPPSEPNPRSSIESTSGESQHGDDPSTPKTPDSMPNQILAPTPFGSSMSPTSNPKSNEPSSTPTPIFRSMALPFSIDPKTLGTLTPKRIESSNQQISSSAWKSNVRTPDFRIRLRNVEQRAEHDLSKLGKVRAIGTLLQTTPFLLATNAEPNEKDLLGRKQQVLCRPIADDLNSVLVSHIENHDLTSTRDSYPEHQLSDPNAHSHHLPIHLPTELSKPATTRNESEAIPTAEASPSQTFEDLSWSTTVVTGVSAIGMIQLTVKGEKAKNSLNAVTNQGTFVLYS